MSPSPDIFGFESTPEEMALARADALQRRKGAPDAQQMMALGIVGQLSGDPVLGGLGKNLMAAAGQQEERGQSRREHALTRALQMLRDKRSAVLASTDDDRAERGLSETIRHNRELEARMGGEKEDARGFRDMKEARNTAEGLRKEILGNEVTKKAQDVAVSYGKLKRVASGTPSAAGDMSLVFSYMKMLDPGSTVREGEYANAQNAAGVPDKIRNAFNKAIDGELLSPDQRKDFLNQAKSMMTEQVGRYKAFSAPYTKLADKYGIDPSEVVLDLGFESDEPMRGQIDVGALRKRIRTLKAQKLKDEDIRARLREEGLAP